jgi:hypothetical protein
MVEQTRPPSVNIAEHVPEQIQGLEDALIG